MDGMMQAMVLVGILAVCAGSGALLAYRHRWAPGPDEPTGGYTVPTPPVPGPPPATTARSLPPATATPGSPPVTAAPGLPAAASGVPEKPSQPVPTEIAAAAPATPARRGRNSGASRFAPAPVRRITPGVYR